MTTLLERIGRWLSVNARAVWNSPPLTGLVVGLWMVLLSFNSASDPVSTFLTVTPTVMLLSYAVHRLTGPSGDEESKTTDSHRAAHRETSRRRTATQGQESASYEPTEDETAIARLRERYAAGEIGDEEFERRLDALLQTEDLTGDKSDRARTRVLDHNEAGQ
ncbi:hypothetical protein C499_10194 [Halogeometricum borinquense DSM 11551]|uniref:Predicted membrane protein (DUF2078) n=2 Tax=Halogeometricum borinquense TaxID=60847 RepID=E4NLI2_HALBP|nr:SHOCT domain-containing protein [Halogeometricum borinquense]ADQ66078.1 Predicted membrane protein (DUF2078) [Halogeometricum borinquense DSM 11551]ELY27426.1 hypothetical protein C499_10194 [Halogeometricum borinquense DSM 11551]RYJ13753.1 SHOCT domain-containing protein [Halogeometricum borinquense]